MLDLLREQIEEQIKTCTDLDLLEFVLKLLIYES